MTDPTEAPPQTTLDAPTGAMKRLILELKKNGPLVFIIDDVQWADRPSTQLWELLRSEGCPMIGILTSSLKRELKDQRPADQYLHLGPLDSEAAFDMLRHSARRWGANINEAGLHMLVDSCRRNPFRLSELAEEFRPGGMLHEVENSQDSSISNLGDVDRFWNARFNRLSGDAKRALAFIATAETAVSMEQLAKLTGQTEMIDVSVSQLVDQRLVHDDATHQACLTVAHDRIAAGLIDNLTNDQRREAHRAWAKLLSESVDSRENAARIATHYYAAGDDDEALPFAILAADNADRAYAKADAARWHECVLDQVAGTAKTKHLRDAARCYREASMPREASRLYRMLADQSSEPNEQVHYATLALRLLLHSGEMERARPLIQALDRRFHREFPLSGFFRGYQSRLFRLASRLCLIEETEPSSASESTLRSTSDTELSVGNWNQCQLDYCAAITRPMAVLDFGSMLRALLKGAELATKCGGPDYRVHFGVMATVWCGVLSGPGRTLDRGLELLTALRHRIATTGSRRATAEVWGGIACLELLAMRWNAVPTGVDVSVRNYALDETTQRFEMPHTRWMRIWASWQLGQWAQLRRDSEGMIEQSNRRSDAYQRLLATSGFGCGAALMLDRVRDSERFAKENRSASNSGVEFADFFQWVHAVQLNLYRGRLRKAAVSVLRMKQSIDLSLIRRVDLIQTITDYLYALVSLHIAESGRDGMLERQIGARHITRHAIRQLRSRKGEFPAMLADLLEGLRRRIDGKPGPALASFESALQRAANAGLTPYRLAAQDAIDQLTGGQGDTLRREMGDAGVVKPRFLERLYTVAPIEETQE